MNQSFSLMSEWNSKNIKTYLVGHIQGKTYVLVHKTHPTISLLRDNLCVGINLDEAELVDGEWYKISCSLHNALCNTLIHHNYDLFTALPETA